MEFSILLAISVISISTLFWVSIGLGRYVKYKSSPRKSSEQRRYLVRRKQVAVLIAAHNEAEVIKYTITSAAQQVPLKNIYVVSDGSTDATVSRARNMGVHVLNIRNNKGKADALLRGIGYFKLCSKYKAVLLLDADTILSPNYLKTALPLFDGKDVVAVAGHAKSSTIFTTNSFIGRILTAYRERIYAISQWGMKYGQAAEWANAISIVPGFASLYRTKALRKINIAPGGLVIEDFNMTFEVHAKKLGRIAFLPNHAVAYTQDPERPSDYLSQVSRWTLGFWQTVARHKIGPSVFMASLSVYVIEIVAGSILLLGIVAYAVLFSGATAMSTALALPGFEQGVGGINASIVIFLLASVIIPDYIITIIAAIMLRRPMYLLYGLTFFALRIIDAEICLMTLIETIRKPRSDGTWKSPVRRSLTSRYNFKS